MSIRILLVDDCEPWCSFVYSVVEKESELQLVGVASDGLTAVHKAKEMKPDLILLDIGLPKLNGFAVARWIRKIVPKSKILFLSQESSPDVVQEALKVGTGFVDKGDAGKQLLPAIRTVILGKRFLSNRVAGRTYSETSDALGSVRLKKVS
jgi:DNA-binding NarL/FixJ family response regulator